MSAVIETVRSITEAASPIVMAALAVLSYLMGRRKSLAEGYLATANARKAMAEAEEAETRASLDSIAGDIKAQLGDIREDLASGMDLVHTRISSMQAEIGEIKHEVTPNHGGSIKDAVKRIEDAQRDDRALAAQRAQETAAQLALIVETHQTSQEVAARDRSRLWGEIEHMKGAIPIP